MDEFTIAYICSHIRINGMIPPEKWTDEQRLYAFAMLPQPSVSLEDFKAKFSTVQHIDEMNEEEKIASNEKTLKLHKKAV